MKCRHCKLGLRSRPRGLCWTCYYTPAICDLYPSTSKFGVRGISGPQHCNVPLPEPTHHEPGSYAKLAVFEDRAAAHQALFHPLDAFQKGLPEILLEAGRRGRSEKPRRYECYSERS